MAATNDHSGAELLDERGAIWQGLKGRVDEFVHDAAWADESDVQAKPHNRRSRRGNSDVITTASKDHPIALSSLALRAP